MTVMVIEEKRAPDKICDFAFALDLVCSVRPWRIASQPFLKIDELRPRRIRKLTGTLFRNDDEIARIQVPANLQIFNYKKSRSFNNDAKRCSALFRNIKTPRRPNL